MTERNIPVDVTLPPSDRLFPFAQVDPENQEDGELNRLLSEHCTCVNSMALESEEWQAEFVETVEKTLFPEGISEDLHNSFPRAFPGLIHLEEQEVEVHDVLGCYYCGRVEIPRSCCDNCRNTFTPPPLGRCVGCSVVGMLGNVCCGCD